MKVVLYAVLYSIISLIFLHISYIIGLGFENMGFRIFFGIAIGTAMSIINFHIYKDETL